MSWLTKSVKKLGKSAKKIAKKATKNPLAIVNPQTYFGGASTGGAAGAASGKSASEFADKGGSAAVVGGALLSTGAAVQGAPATLSAPSLSLPSTAGLSSAVAALDKVRNLAGADQDDGYTAHGAGVGDVTDTADVEQGFSWENASPGIALVLLGVAVVVVFALPSKSLRAIAP